MHKETAKGEVPTSTACFGGGTKEVAEIENK